MTRFHRILFSFFGALVGLASPSSNISSPSSTFSSSRRCSRHRACHSPTVVVVHVIPKRMGACLSWSAFFIGHPLGRRPALHGKERPTGPVRACAVAAYQRTRRVHQLPEAW